MRLSEEVLVAAMVFLNILSSVACQGRYLVKFVTYRNVEGTRPNGTKCDDNVQTKDKIYYNKCQFLLNSTFTHGNKSFGPHPSIRSPFIKSPNTPNANVITFEGVYSKSLPVLIPGSSNLRNPLVVNFTQWKGYLTYKVDVMERDQVEDNYVFELIESFHGTVAINTTGQWVNVTKHRPRNRRVSLEFRVMVQCLSYNTSEWTNNSTACFAPEVSTTALPTTNFPKTSEKARTSESTSTTAGRDSAPSQAAGGSTGGSNKDSLLYILWVALAVGILIIIGTLIFAYKRGLFKFEKREKRETAPDNSAQYSMVPVSSPDRPETRIPDNPDDHIYAEAVKRPKPKEEALYFELEEPPQMKRDPKRPDVDAET